jgi:hypothetical protein
MDAETREIKSMDEWLWIIKFRLRKRKLSRAKPTSERQTK